MEINELREYNKSNDNKSKSSKSFSNIMLIILFCFYIPFWIAIIFMFKETFIRDKFIETGGTIVEANYYGNTYKIRYYDKTEQVHTSELYLNEAKEEGDTITIYYKEKDPSYINIYDEGEFEPGMVGFFALFTGFTGFHEFIMISTFYKDSHPKKKIRRR